MAISAIDSNSYSTSSVLKKTTVSGSSFDSTTGSCPKGNSTCSGCGYCSSKSGSSSSSGAISGTLGSHSVNNMLQESSFKATMIEE
jgi:hypothetical protein